jgi:general secretion pathway protein C
MLNKSLKILLHVLMLALVCAIAAYWAIRIMTPPPAAMPPLQPAAAPREADPMLAARMFGLVQAAPVQLAMNVQALGAFAAGPDSAAVLAIDGKPARVYLVNQEVAPGAKLVEVRKDAVTIEQGGARRDIALPVQEMLRVGGSPPPPGYAREGNTLTAPTVATGGQPAGVAQRPLPPRPLATPQPIVPPAQLQPPPQVQQPPLQQPLQMQAPPAPMSPQPVPSADDTAAESPVRRSGSARPLSQ